MKKYDTSKLVRTLLQNTSGSELVLKKATTTNPFIFIPSNTPPEKIEAIIMNSDRTNLIKVSQTPPRAYGSLLNAKHDPDYLAYFKINARTMTLSGYLDGKGKSLLPRNILS